MRNTAGVESHLQIPVSEYDARIRTFIPHYEDMLACATRAVAALGIERPVLLELGIGSGALAERCVAACPGASIIGIDSDSAMLELARQRLRSVERMDLRTGSFLDVALPSCDVLITSFALHHVPATAAKQQLYAKCRAAVRTGGGLVIADCYRPENELLTDHAMDEWRAHLEHSYSPEESRAYLNAWAVEDTYFALRDELAWLTAAGFRADVLWRQDLWGVLLCT